MAHGPPRLNERSRPVTRFALFLTVAACGLAATSPVGAQGPSADYVREVLADNPVGYWRFDGADGTRVPNAMASDSPLVAHAVGSIKFGQHGPQGPLFPLFDAENSAVELPGQRGYLKVEDPGDDSPLDFGLGDSITLEAWVNLSSIQNGRTAYILGKGRTGNEGFSRENQNYGLRVAGHKGQGRLSFLFRNENNRGGKAEDWHRWDTTNGIVPGTGWHYVAVSYTFGDPDSIRAYINGKPVPGDWDRTYGEPTKLGPVVDNDELWIGSSMSGQASSTFPGLIDEVAIYRQALSPERVAARYKMDPKHKHQGHAPPTAEDVPADAVLVELIEGLPDRQSWDFVRQRPSLVYEEAAFAWVGTPHKYNQRGVRDDWTNPTLMRATALVEFPAGSHTLLIRARNGARLFIDDQPVGDIRFRAIGGGAHNDVKEYKPDYPDEVRRMLPGDEEKLVTFETDGGQHLVRFEMVLGGRKRRPETGESSVSLQTEDGLYQLLSPAKAELPLTNPGWLAYRDAQESRLQALNDRLRRAAMENDAEYWNQRHALARESVAQRSPLPVPEVDDESTVFNDVDRFINSHLEDVGVAPAPLTDDWAFLRRVSIDLLGVPPTPEQMAEFAADSSPDRRRRMIDRLLDDPAWADNWVGYWQDMLAENPSILKPTLNNTGPFRYWIWESLRDNKAVDRMVTELVMMEGSSHFGGPAGFEMASLNDSPMAAKAHVLGQAFLGVQMQCARCHDAPFHDLDQKDLFAMAAMLGRGPVAVPKTSTINLPAEELAKMSVRVTLKPGQRIAPAWPFAEKLSEASLPESLADGHDSRQQLAAYLTGPQNERFAQVMVNRLWKRYLGRAIVEPVDDWEHFDPTHPELLDFLAREFVANGYDLKHVARLILNSHTYQRAIVAADTVELPEGVVFSRLFASPSPRRMTAEQVVDSMLATAGKDMRAEELNFDVDGQNSYETMLNLGRPKRAWELTSLSNERDRPSLALPGVQAVVDVLEPFGWPAARQGPVAEREGEPSVLQPAIVANGTLSRRVVRVSPDSAFTELATREQPVEKLVDGLVRRVLARPPTEGETRTFVAFLSEGYDQRFTGESDPADLNLDLTQGVSWSNHLSEEANRIKLQVEEIVRRGDPPTQRLTQPWRERLEDVVWALYNTPEFVFVP